MPKTASNLSEAFLRVRDYLWDGTGNFTDVYPKQEICIYFAANKAKRAKAITLEQRNKIQGIVQQRLYPYTSVSRYMRTELNSDPTTREVQMFCHGWLVKLSCEFKNKD